MSLRQRRAVPEADSPASTVVETFKKLDLNPKTLDDFKERTGSGGVVSVIAIATIILIVLGEFATYLTPVVSDHLYVDTTRGDRIRVNVNITFPSMPCAGLNLVAMDVAGEQQIDVVNNVIKTRMSLDGRRKLGVEHAEAEMAERLGHQQRQHTRGGMRSGTCGPCFPQIHDYIVVGGGRHCCNSCDEVKKIYASLGNSVALENQGRAALRDGAVTPGTSKQTVHWEEHPICQHEAVLLDPSRLATIKEGCNLFGFLEVNRVAGNFHVAPGKAFQSAQGQVCVCVCMRACVHCVRVRLSAALVFSCSHPPALSLSPSLAPSLQTHSSCTSSSPSTRIHTTSLIRSTRSPLASTTQTASTHWTARPRY